MRAYERPSLGRELFANLLAFKFTVLLTPKIGTKLAAKYPALPVLKPASMLLLKLCGKLRGRHRRGEKGNRDYGFGIRELRADSGHRRNV